MVRAFQVTKFVYHELVQIFHWVVDYSVSIILKLHQFLHQEELNEMTESLEDDPCLDEKIMMYQKKIEEEINESIPLIGLKQEMKSLQMEYFTDDVYQAKVKHLIKHYVHIRRTRPDGNCFYRAFGFAYFEQLLTKKEECKKIREMIEEKKTSLIALGFSPMTLEDFHDIFVETIDTVSKEESTSEDLYRLFNDQTSSDYLVVYLRLLTSGELQQNAEFYQYFIEGGRTVPEFCHHEVEPMYKESDHIHIIALSSALKIGTRVRYMDRADTTETTAHDFPEDFPISIHLLYRPGHYDILYPKEDNTETAASTPKE